VRGWNSAEPGFIRKVAIKLREMPAPHGIRRIKRDEARHDLLASCKAPTHSPVNLNVGAPDCSKPGPIWNATHQAHFEAKHGSAAALAAAARWGTRPFWMGGRGLGPTLSLRPPYWQTRKS
jgi:hypothetical protein